MLCRKSIRSLQHTLVYNQVDFQRKSVDKSTLLDYLLLDIVSWDRKEMVNMDWRK